MDMQTAHAAATDECNEDPASTIEELRAECLARRNVYRLLAGAFAEEPGRAYLEALRTPETLGALHDLGLAFDLDFNNPSAEELEEALACEYTALFASPGGCTPIESARLTGRVQQEPYYAVRREYSRAGFQVQKGRFEIFDDHLGVELSFVAALLDQAASALGRDDRVAFVRADKTIKRFWANHLGRWVRGYASLVERAAEHSFYREMARFLRAFAEEEVTHMKLRVDDLDGGREVVPKSEISVLVNPDEPVCNGCEHGRQSA
jgi:TorA maturation chaperone TorD